MTTEQATEETPRAHAAPEDAPRTRPRGRLRAAGRRRAAMTALLDGRYADVRNLVRANLVDYAEILREAETLDTAAFRDRVRDVVVEMAATGQTGMGFPEQYGGGGDIGASVAAFETLAFGDLSVLVKVGVQFGLFGGAILQLGTERHHDAYLSKLITGELMGCFAMTETGHGSNVQALGTTATYDATTGEFVLTTPDDASRKDYIGNAAAHADVAVVFAQLEIGGRVAGRARLRRAAARGRRGAPRRPDRGLRPQDGPQRRRQRPHLVRRRPHPARQPARPVRERVPEDGTYSSAIDNPNRRFFTMLGTLVQGRVCVGGAGINASKVALAIAIRYAVRRRQFEAVGPAGGGPDPRLRHAPAPAVPAAGAHLRAALRPGVRRRAAARRLLRPHRRRGRRRRSWRRARPAPRRSAPGTPPAPSRSAARRAAARATSAPTASTRSRPTPTSSPPSRATTTCCSSWSPRGC